MSCSIKRLFTLSLLLLGFLFPLNIFADKKSDSKKLADLQGKIENADFRGKSDSVSLKNYQVFKKALDDFALKYKPNRRYVRSLTYYADHLAKSNPREAIKVFHQAKLICDEQNYDTLKAFIVHDLASVYFSNGLLDDAFEVFIQSVDYFKKIEDYPAYGYALIDVGNVYFRRSQFTLAQQYYITAISAFKKASKKTIQTYGLALSYDNIGQVLSNKGEVDSALYYFWKAFEIRNRDSLQLHLYKTYLLIADMYFSNGSIDSSEYYNKKAISICKKNNQLKELTQSYYRYSLLLFTYDTLSALNYMHKAIRLSKDNNWPYLTHCYNYLGKYYENVNIDSAIFYNELMFAEAKRLNNNNYLRIAVARLVNLYQKVGDENKEVKYLRLKVDYANADNANKLYKKELEFESQKWNRERAVFQEQKEHIKKVSNFKTALVVLALVFSIFLIWGLYKLNITTRKLEESNKKLQETIRNKDMIYSIVAHDLRGPVGASLGLVKLMDDDYMDAGTFSEVVPTIRKSLQGTFNLLENLLLWAQLNKDDISLNFEQLKLRDIVTEVIRILEGNASAKDIEVSNIIALEYFVNADKSTVSTIFRNLISNAIKFSEHGGSIEIEAMDQGDFIQVWVKDNGKGMDGEALKKLFVSDEIYTNPGTDNEKGSGLGLKLCKEFVAMNKGKIWVESQVGEGSVFFFTLPKG